ncbi:hypothetical protein UREG_04041 [Uncinocarpus reesii 1704]|uniref:Peptidase metallopeptidase domain-containing protein n=1 Tax=Uncinocarpus reesii (strain UAMH 1704) TaxID=336963 RepID=C4JMI3_UNCRE|nr:uncharacterized protein UREG_04041 [Uncinocarpus reesii 1704]EEP79195.1 hypothetical protein UREG_04041 [Uncinocarpus reesii 1704]
MLSAIILAVILSCALADVQYPKGHPFLTDTRRPRTANYTTVSFVDPHTGIRERITYTLSAARDVLFNDDLSFGPESLLLDWVNNRTDPQPVRRGLGVRPSRAWPTATLVYKYDSCETRELLQGVVDTAIKEWLKGAPYLIFKEMPPSAHDPESEGILTITKHDPESYWCWSVVAWAWGKKGRRMNLQWLSGSGGRSCGQDLSTAIHEFGHALGLMHEHQRPDREEHITIDCASYSPWTIDGCPDPSYPACCTGSTDRCCGDWHNYDIAPSSRFNKYGDYDCKSVMHYSASSVLRSKPGCIISPSTTPTQGDYDALCDIYSTECAPWKGINFCPPKENVECGVCNPVAGLNKCDISTSCISTGGKFHCACRAGFKANAAGSDTTKHFRLPWDNYRHLVFVPENTQCNTLCDNPHGISPELCSEVELKETCPI